MVYGISDDIVSGVNVRFITKAFDFGIKVCMADTVGIRKGKDFRLDYNVPYV